MSSSSHGYTKNHELMIEALNTQPLIPAKSYNLNKQYVKLYIEGSNEEIKDELEKFFKITRHVSYKTFKFLLYNNFREFIHYCKTNKVREITLYLGKIDINNIKEKSNFWVAQHLYQYIKQRKINIEIKIVLDFKKIKDGDTVLILDDCSYSGTQLSSIIFANAREINKKVNVVYYVIIAFISEAAKRIIKINFEMYIGGSPDSKDENVIGSINKLIFSKNNVIIKPLKKLMEKEEIKNITTYYKKYYTEFGATLSTPLEDKYPIYFDHKLADYISTFTDIYSGVVFNKEKKDIIPVMNNCEHINKVDFKDFYNPLCPYPPYKYSFVDGLKTNENYKIKSKSISSSDFNMSQKSLLESDKKIRSAMRSEAISETRSNPKGHILKEQLLKYKKELDKIKYLRELKIKSPKSKVLKEPKVLKEHKKPKKDNKIRETEILKRLKKRPIIPSKSYKKNEKNIEEYIELTKDKIREEIGKFFKITRHISYKEFIKKLYENFDNLIEYCEKKDIESISLYLGKIDESEEKDNIINKSNLWIAQHFYQYVKIKKIKININIIFHLKEIKNKDFILILDDCSYTGTQLSSLFYENREIINKYSNVQFYILTAFISKYAKHIIKETIKDYLKESNKVIFSKKSVIIEPLKKLMTKEEIKRLKKYYIDEQKISEIISLEDKYPIYFDHKLADIFSTYTDIYTGIDVFNNKNSKITPIIEIPESPYKIEKIDESNKNKFKYLSSSIVSSLLSSSSSSLSSSINAKSEVKRIEAKNEVKRECPEGKILNPISKRCIDKNGVTAKKLLQLLNETRKSKTKGREAKSEKEKEKEKRECPEGKILNLKTNRCIDKNGITAKKLLLK